MEENAARHDAATVIATEANNETLNPAFYLVVCHCSSSLLARNDIRRLVSPESDYGRAVVAGREDDRLCFDARRSRDAEKRGAHLDRRVRRANGTATVHFRIPCRKPSTLFAGNPEVN